MEAARWRCLLTALLALGLGGCPGGPQPCIGAPSQAPGQRLVGVGEPVSLTVTADLSQACSEVGEPRMPESVTVQVYDPENQPVPATATLPTGGAAATIRFTPTVTGRHHVVVAFAPVGSLQQFGVHALVDRATERPLAQFPSESSCTYVDRTSRGTWLCGSDALRAPDAAPQPLTTTFSNTVVVAGDVVWTVEASRVLRYVDRGTGTLELTGTAPFAPGTSTGGAATPGPHSRLATEEELLLLIGPSLLRYTFTEAGGVTSTPMTQWSPPGATPFGADGISGLLVRAGGRVLVVGRVSDPRTGESRTQACPFQVGETGTYVPVRDETCHELQGEPVGYEDGEVWTRSFNLEPLPATELLRRYTAASGRLVEQGELSLDGRLGANPYVLRPGPTLPYLTAAGTSGPHAAPSWNPEKGQVELELLPRPDATTPTPRIGGHFIWSDSSAGSGGVRVYARQSTR